MSIPCALQLHTLTALCVACSRDQMPGGSCTSSPAPEKLGLPNSGYRIGLLGGQAGPSELGRREFTDAIAERLATVPGLILLCFGSTSMHVDFATKWAATRSKLNLPNLCYGVLPRQDIHNPAESHPCFAHRFPESVCPTIYTASGDLYLEHVRDSCNVFLVCTQSAGPNLYL